MANEFYVQHINGGRALPQFSIPPALQHQFLDPENDPVDMSAGTWSGEAGAIKLHDIVQPTGIGEGSLAVDSDLATVTYQWAEADFLTVGRFRMILWVGNGTQRFGSTVYEWHVSPAPGGQPSV